MLDYATGKNRIYELDKARNDILTSLEVKEELEEYEVVRNASDEQKHLEETDLDYYKLLQKEKKEIKVRFTSATRGRMSVLRNDILLVYEKAGIGTLYRREDAPWLMEQEYLLYVTKVDEENRIVYLSYSKDEMTREKACRQIDTKLDAGEEVYLRGQIIELQRSSGEYKDRLGAYVNINGLGILGLIPCGKWCSGYKTEDDFKNQIMQNIGSIVSFRILRKTAVPGRGLVYLCDRRDYLVKSGCDPWMTLDKFYRPKQNVKVKIVSEGKSSGSYFASMDGLPDLNFLCYVHDKSSITEADIHIGEEYYGFIQKMDAKKKYCRVRISERAKDTNADKVNKRVGSDAGNE